MASNSAADPWRELGDEEEEVHEVQPVAAAAAAEEEEQGEWHELGDEEEEAVDEHAHQQEEEHAHEDEGYEQHADEYEDHEEHAHEDEGYEQHANEYESHEEHAREDEGYVADAVQERGLELEDADDAPLAQHHDPNHQDAAEQVQEHIEEAVEEEDEEEIARKKNEARMEAARAKAALASRQSASRRASATAGTHAVSRGSAEVAEAALEEVEQEMRNLDAEDASLEKRMGLYAEIVGLKKELATVMEEEQACADKLSKVKALTENGDHEGAMRTVAAHEMEAENSSVSAIWTASKGDEVEGQGFDSEINVENLDGRLAAAHNRFVAVCKVADQQYDRQARALNEHTDEREAEKRKLKKHFDEEMHGLQQTQQRLKQMESEQWHHIRRGTYVKDRQIPQEKQVAIAAARANDKETRLCEDLNGVNAEIIDVAESIKEYKRQLDDANRNNEQRVKQLEAQLKEVEESGADVRALRAKLEGESGDLKDMKGDLQNVLQFVRIRNKNYD